MKKLIKPFILFILILSFSVAVYANSVTELRRQREEAQAAHSAAGNRLKEVRAEKNTLLGEIDELDDELTKVSAELNYLLEQFTLTEQILYLTIHELANATERRENQYESYKKRVRAQYMNGTVGYLDVLLKAENVIDLLNRVEYVIAIVESDRSMSERLEETENLISIKLAETSQAKDELEFLANECKLREAELEDAIKRKTAFINRLNADEALYNQTILDLEADSLRIEQLIIAAEAEEARKIAEAKAKADEEARKAAARAATLVQGGLMAWPVPSEGYISSLYGNRQSPFRDADEFHTGIDIPAIAGADIVAAEGGIVILAGWNGGYGNTVIINHGNGMTTLYGHNSSVTVSVGQEVTKGQVIAKAGSTGYSTGPHLHFEVRINGKHVNPLPYVKN